MSEHNGSPGEDYDVIPSLMDLLTEAMKPLREEKGKVKALDDLGHLAGVSNRQVRRYFDRESSPTAGDLDRLVAAIAVETGGNRLGMWRKALENVEKDVDRAGVDHREEAMKAALAARLPGPE